VISVTKNFLQRRRVLRGFAAAALPIGLASCAAEKQGPLQVGGLPVTCNLTLPVACTAKAAANRAAAVARYEYQFSKYSGWPEIKESLMAGRVQAAYAGTPLQAARRSSFLMRRMPPWRLRQEA